MRTQRGDGDRLFGTHSLIRDVLERLSKALALRALRREARPRAADYARATCTGSSP